MYARTVSSEATHASFGPIKQLAAEISYIIPENIQLFGENMFGVHSIEYDGLSSFFYLFAALENGCDWLAWDHVTELANEMGVSTVPMFRRAQVSELYCCCVRNWMSFVNTPTSSSKQSIALS